MDVRKALRKAVNDSRWELSEHAERQMNDRGFSRIDVRRCLLGGKHVPNLDEDKNGTWRYRIAGTTVDGDKISLAVIIDEDVIVVTVIDT